MARGSLRYLSLDYANSDGMMETRSDITIQADSPEMRRAIVEDVPTVARAVEVYKNTPRVPLDMNFDLMHRSKR